MVQQILKLADAVAVSNGSAIEFTMEVTGGKSRLVVPARDLAFIIQFFAGIASYLEVDPTPIDEIIPIKLEGFEVREGLTPDMMALVVKIGVPLALEMTRIELGVLARSLQIAANAPPMGLKPN